MTTTAPESGNYVQAGGKYYASADAARAAGALPAVPATTSGQSTIDGQQLLAATLAEFNLQGLNMSQVWSEYVNSGDNEDYLLNSYLPTTPAFQNEYPQYAALTAKGYSVQDMANFNNQAQDLGQQFGIPAGFLTPARLADLQVSGWDTTELRSELQNYAVALQHPEIQARLASVDGQNALTPGGLAALFTDGSKAQPLLDQQFNAAAIGGASDRYGVGVSNAEANQLALNNGVTADQADAAFAKVGAAKPLLDALPGEAGGNISSDTAAAAIVGNDPVAQAALTLQQQKRQAQFQVGGGYQSSSTGLAGAGSASNQ